MAITTGSHPKALWPGVYAWFGQKYNEFPVEYTDLFETKSSSKNFEELVNTSGFGLARVKAQGAAVEYDTHRQGYVSRFVHVAYAKGYIVTFEELQDNLYNEVSRARAEQLAFSLRQTKEINGTNVYNRAFNSSYLGGDGKSLLASDHPLADGGTYSNVLSVAADLSEKSIEDLIIQIHGAVDDRNKRIALMPKKLIVPKELWFDANRIMQSVLQNDTANNAVNVLKATNALPEGICMNHYLTDTDAWFIKTNCPNSLIHFTRNSVMFTQDNDFDTMNARAKAYERYVFGWADARGLYGTAGA